MRIIDKRKKEKSVLPSCVVSFVRSHSVASICRNDFRIVSKTTRERTVPVIRRPRLLEKFFVSKTEVRLQT